LYPVKIGSFRRRQKKPRSIEFLFSLMALGLEQNDQKMFIFGHNDKSIDDRLNSLRYARVRRGKQNPVKAFFTYGYVPDVSLQPWYQIPNHFDIKHIYRNGLLDKSNVTFPPWFRLVNKSYTYVNLLI